MKQRLATLMQSGAIFCLIFVTFHAGGAFADELAGTWTLTIDTPRGVQHPTLVIEQNGSGYSGIYNSLRGPIDIDYINRDGSAFSFPLTITVPVGDIQVDYSGTFEGDDMTGSVVSPRGTVPFTAKRQP